MMWLARFFLLYSFYIHPTAALLLIVQYHTEVPLHHQQESQRQITEYLHTYGTII